MKIDTELRHTIAAASRANRNLPNRDSENMKAACAAFLATKKGRGIQAKFDKLRTLKSEAEKKTATIQKQINALLDPVGLDERSNYVSASKTYTYTLEIDHGDDCRTAFMKAGGKLPPPQRRNWSADEVLRKLAAATDQKSFDAILKEYGINWA